jgi:SAM-dependent methyltransferase/predicted transcriptional regulator
MFLKNVIILVKFLRPRTQWKAARRDNMQNQNMGLEFFQDFMKIRAILTAAELDLFTQLRGEASSPTSLARKNNLDLRATTRLLDSLVTIGLLEKNNDLYSVTKRGAQLSSDHPETELPMILHLNGLWDTWSNLTETIRKGENEKRDNAVYRDKDRQEAFIGAMHVIGRSLAEEIADELDLKPFSKLIDIGGGSGTYTMAFLRRNLDMQAILFDLGDVAPLAKKRLKDEGYLDRVTIQAGDLHADPFPEDCDLALLSAIIHMNSPEQNIDLYKRIYLALKPGGVLLIRDHIMDESRTHPPAGTFFALNMLVNTQGGDTYTFGEVSKALADCGFVNIKLIRKGERMDCLVEARKKA